MDKSKKNNLIDVIASMVGFLTFGFTSLVYMIIITRILGVESAGKFSFSFALACTFYVIGVYFGKPFQITDMSNKYSDTDYIYNKITTCIIMMMIALVFCIIQNYSSEKLILILVLTLYRGIDAIVDCYHSIIQKKDRIYKAGVSIFVKSILFMILFLISIIITKNILFSSIIITIFNLIYFLVVDVNLAKKYIEYSKFDKNKVISLLYEGFSVFFFSFLAVYILNAPKYAIDSFANDNMQGIFGIIFMPSSFMSMASLYFIQPYLNQITSILKNNNKRELIRFNFRLTTIIVLMGGVLTLIAYFIGIKILNLLYSVDLTKYALNLCIILIGSIFYSLYTLLSNILVAMRKNKFQVCILIIVSILSILVCNYSVLNFGLNGATYSYIVIMIIQYILFMVGFIYYSNKILERKDK